MVLVSNNSNSASHSPLSAALVITELDPGGAEKAFAKVAAGLKDRGWDVHVYSLRDIGLAGDEVQNAGIPITALNGFRFDPRAIFRLAAAFRRQRPHAVLSFLHEANLTSRLAARIAHVPVQISGIRVADRRLSVAWPERLTSKWVSHYVAVSQRVAEVHAEVCHLSPEKVSVIYNGVDVASSPPKEPVGSETPSINGHNFLRILFVGRLTSQKAPMDLLAAFMRLPQSQRDRAELIFVGEGPLKSELQRIAEPFADRVQLLGWRSDIQSLMESADVLVLPSRWEGLPNVILEAMACGLPVIASRVDGVSELISDGTTGRLFPPGKIDELTSLLSEHLEHPERGQTLAKSAQTFCLSNFTWRSAVDAYDELMRTLIDA